MTERAARRGHAAIGGRILAAGLSTGAAIAFTATIADAARTDTARAASDATAPTPVVVHVVLADGRTADSTVAAAPAVTAAPATARTSARSRAS